MDGGGCSGNGAVFWFCCDRTRGFAGLPWPSRLHPYGHLRAVRGQRDPRGLLCRERRRPRRFPGFRVLCRFWEMFGGPKSEGNERCIVFQGRLASSASSASSSSSSLPPLPPVILAGAICAAARRGVHVPGGALAIRASKARAGAGGRLEAYTPTQVA